jgi:hypothetical protein
MRSYIVRVIVKEIYFVEAESEPAAVNIVHAGDVQPSAWETLVVEAAEQGSQRASSLAARGEDWA